MEKEELAKKFSIDLKKLEEEQEKLAKKLEFKKVDFEKIETIAGCDCASAGNKIIAAIVVCDKSLEIIEKNFFVGKSEFPYIPGFLSYREMPAMLECYKQITQEIDIFLIDGNGILHPRKLGIASHFGLLVQKPTIGIAKSLLLGKEKDNYVYVDNEKRAAKLITKEGSNPIYISPGNLIDLASAEEIVKKCLKHPHKLPEPLMLAHRYAEDAAKEFRVR